MDRLHLEHGVQGGHYSTDLDLGSDPAFARSLTHSFIQQILIGHLLCTGQSWNKTNKGPEPVKFQVPV